MRANCNLLYFTVIGSQFPWAMEDSKTAIVIAMNGNRNPDVMTAILIRRDLPFQPLELYTIVVADSPVTLFAKDVFARPVPAQGTNTLCGS